MFHRVSYVVSNATLSVNYELKQYEMKTSWPILSYYQNISMEKAMKINKNLVSSVDLRTKFRSRSIRSMNLQF
jgi:hypothetical protein